MFKAEQPGVERQSLMWPTWMVGQFGFIARITEHRMPGFGKMHTNLITSPSFEPHLHECRAVEICNNAIVRNRQLPDRFVISRKPLQVFVRRQQAFKRPLL